MALGRPCRRGVPRPAPLARALALCVASAAAFLASAFVRSAGAAWLGRPVGLAPGAGALCRSVPYDTAGSRHCLSPSPLVPSAPRSGLLGPLRPARARTHTSRQVQGLLSHLFATYPYSMDFLTCFIKGFAADQVSQRFITVDRISWRRTLSYGLYAGGYQGCCQHFIFNVVFPILFGMGTDPVTVAKKVCAENFCVAPLLCLPTLYVVKGKMFGKGLRESVDDYWKDVRNKGILFRYWTVWVPVQCVVFSIIPVEFRIAFIAMVSFFWLICLSTIAGGKQMATNSAEGKQMAKKH